MAVNGRINVDVLFHDTDGTTSLKVVSLEGSTELTTGQVAIVTGTVGTASVTIDGTNLSYRNAAGEPVVFGSYSRVVFESSRDCVVNDQNEDDNRCRSNGKVAMSDFVQSSLLIQIRPAYTAGTASYTLVMYGT
jgi:hypothetical protein